MGIGQEINAQADEGDREGDRDDVPVPVPAGIRLTHG
jgi:hypothetical protein